MVGIVLTIHLAMLALGLAISRRLGFSPEDAIAVGLSGSQKTLMVGLQVGMELGFSILPIVTFHVGQLLVDTLIADYYRQHVVQRQPPSPPK